MPLCLERRAAVEWLREGERDKGVEQFEGAALDRGRGGELVDLLAAAAPQTLPSSTSPGGSPSGTGSSRSAPARRSPGPGLPDPDDADQFLPCWQEAFEEGLGALDAVGRRIPPGMLTMLGEQFGQRHLPADQAPLLAPG